MAMGTRSPVPGPPWRILPLGDGDGINCVSMGNQMERKYSPSGLAGAGLVPRPPSPPSVEARYKSVRALRAAAPAVSASAPAPGRHARRVAVRSSARPPRQVPAPRHAVPFPSLPASQVRGRRGLGTGHRTSASSSTLRQYLIRHVGLFVLLMVDAGEGFGGKKGENDESTRRPAARVRHGFAFTTAKL
uniref:Uncharacterized protein n=1 Tax=Oryza sativa subsp. japonica TaxID=39947 RepID=Q9FWT8_ORYSJ|nr:hypothetical protein [Oryza sativa Japonica Group]